MEVAVSVGLVLMTGLLTTSLLRLLHVDRGFEAARVATARVDLPSKSYSELGARAAFYKQVLDRLSRLPGVEHAAVVSMLPLSGDTWIDMIRVPGDSRAVMQVPSEHFRLPDWRANQPLARDNPSEIIASVIYYVLKYEPRCPVLCLDFVSISPNDKELCELTDCPLER